ncbi:FAD-dependent oxidoreductase [Mesorhizobium sp. M0174]|uniref:flavin monoamine oxidase family protein n=1 Tax=Mesorhizobium sp. M0174 TaxID=2956904 RepID=UPI00333B9B09
MNNVDVIVVGGGLSGLYSAIKLQESGVKTVVLEARDRVGGMTYSPYSEVLRQRIDLGGQWVGDLHKRMYGLIHRYKAPIVKQFTGGARVRIHGKQTFTGPMGTVPGLNATEVEEQKSGLVTLERALESIPTDYWQGDIAYNFDSQTFSSWVDSKFHTQSVRGLLKRMTSSYYGAAANEISALDALNKFKACGGPTFQAGVGEGAQEEHLVGAAYISERMAEEIGNVVLSADVREIKWSDKRVEVRTSKGEWGARFLVCAMSPTMISQVQFYPVLPAIRRQFHQRFPIGQYTKVALTYPKQFWRDRQLSGNVICMDGSIGSVYDLGSESSDYPVLAALFGGVAGKGISQLSNDERKSRVLNIISQALGNDAAKPIDYQEQIWAEDAWAAGASCSFTTPGAITAIGYRVFAPTGPIYWAGTQAARQFPGYMEGALVAGEAAALGVMQSASGGRQS